MPDAEVNAESSPAAATDTTAAESHTSDETESAAQDEQSSQQDNKSDSEQEESASASEAANQERSEGRKYQQRINQLTRQLRTMERKFADVTRGQQADKPATEPVEPRIEDYDDPDKFKADVGKFKENYRKWAIDQDRQERSRQEQAEAKQKADAKLAAEWMKRESRLKQANPDFNALEAMERIGPTPVMDGFFVDSEVGPELIDYYDTNPDEADKVRDMEPYKAIRALIHLEDEISRKIKGIQTTGRADVVPIGRTNGRATSPAKPKSAADTLYG